MVFSSHAMWMPVQFLAPDAISQQGVCEECGVGVCERREDLEWGGEYEAESCPVEIIGRGPMSPRDDGNQVKSTK